MDACPLNQAQYLASGHPSHRLFTFDDDYNLVAPKRSLENVPNGLNDNPLYFDASAVVFNPSFGATAASCNIVNNAIACAVRAVKIFYVCEGDTLVNIVSERAPTTCNVRYFRQSLDRLRLELSVEGYDPCRFKIGAIGFNWHLPSLPLYLRAFNVLIV